ncbi:MAG: exonuclease domain-containing protein [Chloroflexota bacterium]|nr:exonuclease domain-containing protein [Chloroflexota bacterium]
MDANKLIDEVPLAFCDVETTGLHPGRGDRVCEIAVLRCRGDRVVKSFQHLVNPQRPVSRGAYAVHGIDDKQLRRAPLFAEVADDVLALLDDAVFVGHNAPFDLGFLSKELGLLGITFVPEIVLDTLRLARRRYVYSSYALDHLAHSLNIQVAGRAHRAMADVLLTRGLFRRLVSDFCSSGVQCLQDYVDAQGGNLACGGRPPAQATPVVWRALHAGGLLRLRYRSMSGAETVRLVRPLALAESGSRTYLRGYCFLRDAERTFRLDRILEADIVDDAG